MKINYKVKEEIKSIIDQQELQARDSAGVRWCRCEKCKVVAPVDEFIMYGGIGRINLGLCRKCEEKNRRMKK